MENEIPHQNNLGNDDMQSLSSIYRQIAVEINECYDEIDENQKLYDYIDNCFTIEIKQIDNKKFKDDMVFFNTKLVEYIKFCAQHDYTKINIIFIIFCDYFDLPYNLMFNNLHPKIKDTILKRYINLIGIAEYNKQKMKYEIPKDYIQPTLFDLIINK